MACSAAVANDLPIPVTKKVDAIERPIQNELSFLCDMAPLETSDTEHVELNFSVNVRK